MLNKQLNIFDQPADGARLAEVGLELAVETADKASVKWSERCWMLFYQWLNKKPRYFEFMIEDFREYLDKYDLLETPPSKRAFGFISKRAIKRELIVHAGIARVKNPGAHATPANVWRKK